MEKYLINPNQKIAKSGCLKCGCYPEFRAAFAANGCPAKKW